MLWYFVVARGGLDCEREVTSSSLSQAVLGTADNLDKTVRSLEAGVEVAGLVGGEAAGVVVGEDSVTVESLTGVFGT